MEFPISRSRLQNYRVNEAVSAEVRIRVSKEIKNICTAVERIVLTSDERKYVYRIAENIKYPADYPGNSPVSRMQPAMQPISCVKELIESIRYVFPDSNITMDPLETYIIIDWS